MIEQLIPRVSGGELIRAHKNDAGCDIKSNEQKTIPARGSVVVSTGIHVDIPRGFVGLIWSRSGLSVKHKIEVGAGCIDCGYTGEILVHLFNHSDVDYHIEKGDKIAQMLLMPVFTGGWLKVETIDNDTERGDNGFNSTGR